MISYFGHIFDILGMHLSKATEWSWYLEDTSNDIMIGMDCIPAPVVSGITNIINSDKLQFMALNVKDGTLNDVGRLEMHLWYVKNVPSDCMLVHSTSIVKGH